MWKCWPTWAFPTWWKPAHAIKHGHGHGHHGWRRHVTVARRAGMTCMWVAGAGAGGLGVGWGTAAWFIGSPTLASAGGASAATSGSTLASVPEPSTLPLLLPAIALVMLISAKRTPR